MIRTSYILGGVLLVFLLSGCAAQQAYRDGQHLYETGQVEEGLAKIEKAYKLEPGNSEYRSQYFRLRERIVFKWLSQADAAKNNTAWEEAGNYYNRILKIDSGNTRAKLGLSSLNTEKLQTQLLADARELLEKDDLAGAIKKVRQILAESPSQPAALKLKKSIEAKVVASNQSDVIFKSKLSRSITIEFNDAPIKTIFDFIAKVSNTNFIFDKEVRSDMRASLLVRDARIEDAIRFLLLSNQLEQRILNGNTLYIYPNTPQKLKDFQEMRVKNFYLSNANAKDVAAMLKSIVKTKDMYVDDKANLIVMRDTPDVIRIAERLVAAQDIAEPEAVLDVEVLEVGTNLLETIGIQYPSQVSFSVVGAAGTPGTAMLPEILNRNAGLVRATISDPALVINMLHQDGGTNLLANPKIRVKNREKASVHIGDKVPVITNTTTATGLVAQSVTYLDVGLKLDVEPTVYLENDVGIKVGLEVSNITKQIQNANGTLTYQIGTRNATTVLRLKDGETQMLAGLINREDRRTANSVPGLGQLPILGRLFSSNTDTATKTEVVLLITPHVVRNIVRPDSPVEEFSSGTESAIRFDRMELNTTDAVKSEKGEEPPRLSAETSAVETKNDTEVVPALPALGHARLALNVPPQVQSGRTFTASVNLQAEGLQNAMLSLSYDPAKLTVVKVEEGDFLKKPDGKTQFLQQVNDKTGRISINVIRQGNVQGEGGLASVTFQSLDGATGSTQLRADAANFSDAAGRMLPIDSLPVASTGIIK